MFQANLCNLLEQYAEEISEFVEFRSQRLLDYHMNDGDVYDRFSTDNAALAAAFQRLREAAKSAACSGGGGRRRRQTGVLLLFLLNWFFF